MVTLILPIIALIGCFLLIWWGADTAIDSVEGLSKYWKISPLVLVLFVLGVDLEEFIASVQGAVNGYPEIAIGNVIGNNLITLTLVFGLPALFFTLKLKKISRVLFLVIEVMNILILFAVSDPNFIRIAGILNLLIYVLYITYVFMVERPKLEIYEGNGDAGDVDVHPHENKERDCVNEEGKKDSYPKVRIPKKNQVKNILLLIASIGSMYLGSEILVWSAKNILTQTLLQESFMGVVIVAALTNIEEYFLLFGSIRKNRTEISMNVLLGKILWNSGATFGISSIILRGKTSFPIEFDLIFNAILAAIIVIPLVGWIITKKKEVTRTYGIILLILFIIYIGISVGFQVISP